MLPISINALGPAVIPNGDGTFSVTSPTPVPASASGTGVAAMEGHPAALGTTIATGSSYGPPKVIDTNPANDLNITPTAAVCSACHDDRETRAHMLAGGARFDVLQADIDSGAVRERCVNCHGRGRERDVRKEHGLGGIDND